MVQSDRMSNTRENEFSVVAHAPCRADLAGGTLDLWPLYLFHPGAITVNFALEILTTCRIKALRGKRIHLRSVDTKREEEFRSLDDLNNARKLRHPVAARLVQFFLPQQGLLIETDSQSPAGAGISGSSALMIATTAALARFAGRMLTWEQMRMIAQNVEAQIIDVPTGCQDYYPALYGGVSAIHLDIDRNHRPIDRQADCRRRPARRPRGQGLWSRRRRMRDLHGRAGGASTSGASHWTKRRAGASHATRTRRGKSGSLGGLVSGLLKEDLHRRVRTEARYRFCSVHPPRAIMNLSLGPGGSMPGRVFAISVLVLLAAALASADDKQAPANSSRLEKAPPISKQTRMDLIRAFNAELVYIRSPFPMGKTGLRLENGVITPDRQQLQMPMAT